MVTLFLFLACLTVAVTMTTVQMRLESRTVTRHGIPARTRRIR